MSSNQCRRTRPVLRQPSPSPVPAADREKAVSAILRAVVGYGEHDSKSTRFLRDNVRYERNRFARTLCELVEGDPVRARKLAGLILTYYAPTQCEPLSVLNVRETAEEGELNNAQIAYATGDHSGPVLALLIGECDDVIPLYQAMRESASQELAA